MERNLKPFQGDEHQPFDWPAGKGAVLLVHGFPGTPAELRPLAGSLHQAGWSVQALLLPGFGPEIETLFDKEPSDWIGAVAGALADLQQQYDPVVLIGYSMGAALAVQVAVKHKPAGLVLLAPFQQFGTRRQQFIGRLLKPFFRHVYPFKKADFSDPEVRQAIKNFFPDVDLDDPEIQQSLREVRLPMRIFEHLNQVGQTAQRLAGQVDAPTMIIQGAQDEVVHPQGTRKLLQQWPKPIKYTEVVAGHDLLNPKQDAWPAVEGEVLSFVASIQQQG